MCNSQGVLVRAADSEGAAHTMCTEGACLCQPFVCCTTCSFATPRSPVPAWSHKDIPNCCSEQIDAYQHCHTSASITTKQARGIINKSKEFGPSCVRHSGRQLGARISHRIVSTTTTRQARVFGDHRRQGCIGLRAATHQGSRVAHYRKLRPGSSGTSHTIRFTLPTHPPGCARHPLQVKFNSGGHDI